jgi:hypothetical protein
MNKHITEYLDYYIKIKNPQYAVLLIGKWGCGKTYYIKNLIKEWNTHDKQKDSEVILKPIYISLNGIGEINTVNDKIRAEISPFFKVSKVAKNILKGLIKTTIKIDLDIDKDGENDGNISFNPDLLGVFSSDDNNIKGNKILIFDDIERCKIGTDEIFGYINNFVEHLECKVILLADEDKIREKYDKETSSAIKYKDFKEKLIGQTFEVSSDINNAVDFFIEEAKNTNDNINLEKHKALIIEIFNASELKNLRVLRQALLDFYRLTTYVDEKFTKHNRYDEFIKNFAAYFLIIYIEYKTGNDKITEFQNAISSYLKNNNEESAVKIAERKYNIILQKSDIYNSMYVFPFDKIQQYIEKGTIEKDLFNQIIKSNTFFATDERQNWEKLYQWKILDDKSFREIRDKVWKQFIQGKINQPLAITHIAGILISLIDDNLLNKNKAFVISKVKQILNRIVDNDYVKNNNIYGLLANAREYHAESSIELKEITDYLYEKVEVGRNNIRSSHLKNIFENLVDDNITQQIYPKLSQTQPDFSQAYEYSAIFEPVNGKVLGKRIKTFSSKSIFDFKNFIHYRYYPEERFRNGKLEDYHKNDKTCLEELKTELSKGLKKREIIKNKAINNLIEELEKIIDKLQAMADALKEIKESI